MTVRLCPAHQPRVDSRAGWRRPACLCGWKGDALKAQGTLLIPQDAEARRQATAHARNESLAWHLTRRVSRLTATAITAGTWSAVVVSHTDQPDSDRVAITNGDRGLPYTGGTEDDAPPMLAIAVPAGVDVADALNDPHPTELFCSGQDSDPWPDSEATRMLCDAIDQWARVGAPTG